MLAAAAARGTIAYGFLLAPLSILVRQTNGIGFLAQIKMNKMFN